MSDPFIKVENLTKTYKWGRFKAVDDVSFSVEKGEIFGLIGPNGAGKTTIMGCLLALLKPSKGAVTIDGMSPFDLEVKARCGFLPERPHFDAWMSVKQFLWYHHALARRPESESAQAIINVIDLVELDRDVLKKKVRELSRGMLQRVGLAQALIGKPTICFFDEPTSGMDPLGFMLMRKILLNLRENGATVVLNSHHLDEVEKVCDRVAFIKKGKISAIEDLSGNLERKQTLVLSWSRSQTPSMGEIETVLAESGCKVLQRDELFVRLLVASRQDATDVIKNLVQIGAPLYEATWERKSLVELFLDEPPGENSQPADAPSTVSVSDAENRDGGNAIE